MTKNVAIFVNSAWGAFNFRLNLARYLKNNGHSVFFIFPPDQIYTKEILKEFDYSPLEFNRGGLNPFYEIFTCYKLWIILKRKRPDLILNFTVKPNIYGSIIGRLLQIDSINNVTGLGTAFIDNKILSLLVKRLYKYSLSLSKHTFFQNLDDEKLFKDNDLVLKNRFSLIPGSGVDIQKFSPVDSCDSNLINFLMVGRLIRDKGIFEYIEAAKEVKKKFCNVEFGILGPIDDKSRNSIDFDFIKRVEEKGIVKYFGSTDDVKKFLSKTNCVILPSYREGSPRSIMEASAMQIPVLASNVPGCRQVVKNGVTGFLFEKKNSKDLVRKIEKFISLTDSQKRRMGIEGRKKMLKEFDESFIFRLYDDIISK